MTTDRRVFAFYKFVEVKDPEALREHLAGLEDLKGTILVAPEGVNGTVVGSQKALAALRGALETRIGHITFKLSDLDPDNPGFYRYKVRCKPEIVSFGVDGLDISQTGEHVDPERWNELLVDEDVVVIDTRNQYEVDIGSFPGAISPETTNFREFPEWVENNLEAGTKVAMFCTGGIRCEKASAYLRQNGFDEVYQLDGGILSYLEHVASDDNRWEGECFVFDQRVSVTSDLNQGGYEQCFACRHPVSAEDRASRTYQQGVSCPHCFDQERGDRDGFRERQKQVELAQQRGEAHIGMRHSSGSPNG